VVEVRPWQILVYSLVSTVIIGGIIYFIYGIAGISVNDNEKTIITGSGISGAKIYRNNYGIPHIESADNSSLFFAMGYAHASDRLWQMDYARLFGSGKMASVFGKDALELDLFMRSFDIPATTDSIINSLPSQTRSILQAYSDGVNEYIENNKYKLSFEFHALDHNPKAWKPADCILIGRVLGFYLSFSIWADPVFGSIAERLGYERAMELVPSMPMNSHSVLAGSGNLENKFYRNKLTDAVDFFSSTDFDYKIIHEKLNKYGRAPGSSLGSNCWAVIQDNDSTRTATLANDPHFLLSLPSPWYQISIDGGDYKCAGLSIPGIPALIIGRNDDLAWGVTNIMADDLDFFIEQIDSTGNYYTDTGGNRQALDMIPDTIHVRDSLDLIYYKKYCGGRPLISETHLLKLDSNSLTGHSSAATFINRYDLSFEWSGNQTSDEVSAILSLMKSGNLSEGQSSIRNWGFPAFNFTMASSKGEVGNFPAGFFPKRGRDCNPNMPNPAWLADCRWEGFGNFSELGENITPSSGFVASANNVLDYNSIHHISNYLEPESRIERIVELLENIDDYSVREAQYMQKDLLSPYAREISKIILPVLEKSKDLFDSDEFYAYEILYNWDFIMSVERPAPLIFNVFMKNLSENTFRDELKEDYEGYVFITSLPTNKLKEFIFSGSDWFDDIETEERETRDYQIYQSFRDAVAEIKGHYGEVKAGEWRWGDLHTLDLHHVLSRSEFLKGSVSITGLEMGGNNTTINNTEWSLITPYKVRVGASSRFIANLADTVIHTSIPGGASGDPVSPNYSDQVRIWQSGGYIRMPFSENTSENYSLKTTIKPR
jgi:penicillin amidase